jgi:hypothetical protein
MLLVNVSRVGIFKYFENYFFCSLCFASHYLYYKKPVLKPQVVHYEWERHHPIGQLICPLSLVKVALQYQCSQGAKF